MTDAPLEQLDKSLWSIDHPDFSVGGLPIGTKTGIIRLNDGDDGDLALITPGPLTDRQIDAIDELGEVAAIVATNRLHHLFLEEACERFPDAQLIGAPGLPDKRDDLEFDAEMSNDSLPAPLAGSLDHHVMQGTEETSEVVLFHPSTDTIFVTDIGFNLQKVEGLWPRLVMWFNGGWGRYEITFIARQSIDDTEAFLRSIDTILEWPFRRIWLPHGTCVDEDAREQFRRGYDILR